MSLLIPAQQSRMLFIQLRTPVQLLSGLRPDAREKFGRFTDYEVAPHCDMDTSYVGGSTANGLTYSECQRSLNNDCHHHEYEDESPTPAPPTYDEAVNDRMENGPRRSEMYHVEVLR